MVEQRIENPRVGSSILSLATSLLLLSTACAGPDAIGPFEDDCEATCRVAARKLDDCLAADEWSGLGADDGTAWRNQCQLAWEDMRRDLSDLERDQALESCTAMLALVRDVTCEELAELYRPRLE